MATEFPMPKLGLSMVEGRIVRWLLPEGTRVSAGTPVFELESDKAIAEAEAVTDGWLHIVVPEGEVAPVGAVVALVAETELELVALQSGNAWRPGNETRVPDIEKRPAAAQVVAGGKAIAASPLARRLAKELGIELSTIVGTGPGGEIKKEDVLRLAGERQSMSPSSDRDDQPVPLQGVRKVIAERMLASLSTAAQLTTMREIEISELVNFRSSLSPKPSFTAVMIRAASLALRRHPELNAHMSDEGIRSLGRVRMGVAVDSARGLLVPVLDDPDQHTLAEVDEELKRLRQAADAGTLEHSQLTGSSFTVTTTGAGGADFGTPILNLPEVAILLVGRVREVWRWRDGQPRRHFVAGLSLTYDHRAVDGVPTTRFLATIEEICGNPHQLL